MLYTKLPRWVIFISPIYRTRLPEAARLTGLRRYVTDARLDAKLASMAARLVAHGIRSTRELFSARTGCPGLAGAWFGGGPSETDCLRIFVWRHRSPSSLA